MPVVTQAVDVHRACQFSFGSDEESLWRLGTKGASRAVPFADRVGPVAEGRPVPQPTRSSPALPPDAPPLPDTLRPPVARGPGRLARNGHRATRRRAP